MSPHSSPLLLAFDLDDTLAPSKQRLPAPMAEALADLSARIPLAVITGGAETQILTQVIDALPARTMWGNLHLLPTCGTRYLTYTEGAWQPRYAITLTSDQRDRATDALEGEAKRLGLWEANPWGAIIEDRGSQITFSALGQEAPLEAKRTWDPDGMKKQRLAAAVAALLPDLEVRSGGSTSVDITLAGIDKAYGMAKLAEQTRIALADMLFVGDRLDPDGNDYPVIKLGVPVHAVRDWEDTLAFLVAFRNRLP